MHILIVEDEPRVAAFIKKGLTEQHFTVDMAFDGPSGIKLAKENSHDVIVLDIILPGINGIEVCKEIRKFNKKVPILMLTALGTTDDKVKGLSSGADDYLVKPFHFREFMARIEALSRRRGLVLDEKKIIFGDLELDMGTRTARRAGKELALTAKEYALLELFLNNQDKVLSRAFIAEAVWGIDYDTGTNVIDVYVNYLRNKVDKGFPAKLIHTVVGMGYVLRKEF